MENENEKKIINEAQLLCYNAFELKNIEIDLNDAIIFCKNHSGSSDMLLCMYFKEILDIDISNDALKYNNQNFLTNSNFDNNSYDFSNNNIEINSNNLDENNDLSEIYNDYKKFNEIFPNTDYKWFEERYNKLTVSNNGNTKLEQMIAFI